MKLKMKDSKLKMEGRWSKARPQIAHRNGALRRRPRSKYPCCRVNAAFRYGQGDAHESDQWRFCRVNAAFRLRAGLEFGGGGQMGRALVLVGGRRYGSAKSGQNDPTVI